MTTTKKSESHRFLSKRDSQWKDPCPSHCPSYTGIIPPWIPLDSSVQSAGWTRLYKWLMTVTREHLQSDSLKLKTRHVLLSWEATQIEVLLLWLSVYMKLTWMTKQLVQNVHNIREMPVWGLIQKHIHSDYAPNWAPIINWINQTTCSWLSP